MERRTLTVQSESVNADMVYDLTEEEVKKLATASIEEQPVEKRLDLLNGIIGADFADKVTMEQLNSEQRISIGLHPEVRHELEERQRQEQELFMQQETPMRQEYIQGSIGAAVDGRDLQLLNESKGWYREEKHGREVESVTLPCNQHRRRVNTRCPLLLTDRSSATKSARKTTTSFLLWMITTG